MKELTIDEYNDRLKAIERAMHIFGELTDNNITKSFQAYQAIFAEREREIFIATVNGKRARTVMDKYERPQCPDCGSDMMFRQVKQNDEGIVTQLVCSNQQCDTVLSSDKTLVDWMNILKVKDETK